MTRSMMALGSAAVVAAMRRLSSPAPARARRPRDSRHDADSHYDVADAGGFGIHLGENSTDFLAANEDIVGPLQIGDNVGVDLRNRRANRESSRERQHEDF